jgi:hypothetical protein
MKDLNISELLKEAIDKVRETRDVYVSIFIWGNDISIGVYPYDEDEVEE